MEEGTSSSGSDSSSSATTADSYTEESASSSGSDSSSSATTADSYTEESSSSSGSSSSDDESSAEEKPKVELKAPTVLKPQQPKPSQSKPLTLMERLSMKPKPKTSQSIMVKSIRPREPIESEQAMFEEGEVDIEREKREKRERMKIVDKRAEGFNRDAFLAKLKEQGKIPQLLGISEQPKPTKTKPAKKTTKAQKTQFIADDEDVMKNLFDGEDYEEDDDELSKKKPKKKPTKDEDSESESYDEIERKKPTKKLTLKKRKPSEIADSEKVIIQANARDVMIDGKPIIQRLPRRKRTKTSNDAPGVPHIRLPSYFMNNREKFVQFINNAFMEYKDELRETKEVSCETRSSDDDGFFTLMTHQKIVRDYLANYTPYRGLLLYHGLGSGKTCSSIAIAEGLKTERQVIVMTPASLRTNYIEELKHCGDPLYKKRQYWEFISTKKHPEWVEPLSQTLGLSPAFIKKQDGAWLVDAKKSSNYERLSTKERNKLDIQLDKMIGSKYKFISYNGLTKQKFNELTQKGTINIFNNKVIVIDEVHNFVSRIINQLKKKTKASKQSISVMLYNMILSATNCRIVFLSGTPIINYPNELAILFNMLRGNIDTWNFTLDIIRTDKPRNVNEKYIKHIFQKVLASDYISYEPKLQQLSITRNPFGFINRYKTEEYRGVSFDERGNITNTEFKKLVAKILNKNEINIRGGFEKVIRTQHKALPDDYEQFKNLFFKETGEVHNLNLFQRRILGLTSYYRSAQEQLMPRFDANANKHIVELDMSSYQVGIYEKARKAERNEEKSKSRAGKMNQGGDIYEDVASSYRVFSRAFCNFVFPEEMVRPLPSDTSMSVKKSEKQLLEEALEDELFGDDEPTDEILETGSGDYKQRLKQSINRLRDMNDEMRIVMTEDGEISRETGLGKYSPKFASIIINILNEEFVGSHLVYSQFRSVEGIELLTVAMEANGFTPFRVKSKDGEWYADIDEDAVKAGRPMYALYTGTESKEEREIVRNFFNSTWELVPSKIIKKIKKLRDVSRKNIYGDIVKVFMITASGAEGISLRNTRKVHIVEPHWHPVRIEQVIGRARRICSHQDLPPEMRTVDVYLYLMRIPKTILDEGKLLQMKQKDRSRLDNKKVITSDQYLYEIMTIKEDINRQFLDAIKSTAIDCILHADDSQICLTFGDVSVDKMSYIPSIEKEDKDENRASNMKKTEIKYKVFTFYEKDQYGNNILDEEGKPKTKKYALRNGTNQVYDYESMKNAERTGMNPIKIGKLIKIKGEYAIRRDD